MSDYYEEKLVTQSRGIDYHYYLSTEISGPEDYVELINCLRFAGPEDAVYIHINSVGGCLHTAIQIINEIKKSSATVVGCAEGLVASAASMIFFSCSHLEVNPFTTFMIHDGSGGNVGKVNENLVSAQAHAKLLKKVYQEIYHPFLTHREISRVLKGGDLWLDSDEVVARIEMAAQDNEMYQED